MKVGFIDKFIVFLLTIILIIDSINGFLIFNKINTGISLSQLIKFPILFLMMFRIFLLNRKYFIHLLIIILVLVFSVFINYINAINVTIFSEVTLILKLLVIPISLYYFVCLKNVNYHYYYNSVVKIFKIAFVVLFINIFLSLIGVGYSSYAGGIGNKGFFYAGNELSAVYLIVSSFLLQYVFKNNKRKYYYLLAAISIGLGVLISTKVSMLSILVIVILIPIYGFNLKITPKFIRNSVFVSLISVVVLFVLIENIVNGELYARWVYFFKVYDYNLVSILLSGRNITLVESWNMNASYFEPFQAFFGYTYSGFIENLKQSSFYRAKANEMDFFDLYFIYGLLGLLSILSIWFVAFYNYFTSKKKNTILLISCLLILFISFISGHVLYSGLSGPFIGIYLSLMFHFKTNKLAL
ncbi:MAG: O-antigen ligase family protein [Chitinophagales bacterium]